MDDSKTSEDFGALMCDVFKIFCDGIENIVLEHSLDDDDQVAYQISTGHEPSGTSTLGLSHYCELVRRKNFSQLDTGELYDLSKINFPVCMHVGMDDNVATVADNRNLKSILQSSNVLHFYQEYPHTAHSTFFLGKSGLSQFLDDAIQCAKDFTN